MSDILEPGAIFSNDGRWRYALTRYWPPTMAGDRTATFVMLNPSTADAEQDDPTIRRCIGFAKREGCNRLIVVNLFAYRATDPKALRSLDLATAWGPENTMAIVKAVNASDILVAAWGSSLPPLDRPDITAVARFARRPLLCLGTTRTGQPRHPLYVRGDAALHVWCPPVPT